MSNSKKLSIALFLILVGNLFFNISCSDSENPSKTVSAPLELATDSIVTLEVNDFTVDVSQTGTISKGIWQNGSTNIGCIYLAGLWISIENSGNIYGNIVSTAFSEKSNYIASKYENIKGVFSLDSDFEYLNNNWPSEIGAPVDESGKPKVYGDQMCWSVFESDTTLGHNSVYSRPIKHLKVTQTIYGYKSDELRNVLFIKYGILNSSSEDWNNVTLGFFSDTDLPNTSQNQTGYDSTGAISFTYERGSNTVAGFCFLETPNNLDENSHRIMRKNDYYDPDFGEYTFTSYEQIPQILNGLSNDGNPMINPVTGLPTKFAFTGNPVTETGWIDTPVDVRSLLSLNSFTLGAGETTWVTIAWVITQKSDLESSITAFKNKINDVKANKSLWQFN